MNFLPYLTGILGLALLMVVHEGGHFLAARAFGLRVLRFSIGFGPTLVRIEPEQGRYWLTFAGGKLRFPLGRHDPERHGPTIYQVALLPFLAFVQVAGMNPLEEVDPEDKGSYANAGLWARIVTIVGGPLANYLFASLLFFLSFWFGGKLVFGETTEVEVLEGRPAAAAGLRAGDAIVAIDGAPIAGWPQLAETISKKPDQRIALTVRREQDTLELALTPANEGGKGKIGVAPRGKRVPLAAGESAKLALQKPAQVVRELVVGLGELVTGKSRGDLSGPAGIVKETARAARSGWTDLVFFLGALSAYLGAFNMIPFPALDGGRLTFLGYEALAKRRPNAKVEAQIHALGLMLMLGLMLYVTFVNDLRLGGK